MNDEIFVARHHAEVLANCIGQLVDDRLPEYLISMCNDLVEELIKFSGKGYSMKMVRCENGDIDWIFDEPR